MSKTKIFHNIQKVLYFPSPKKIKNKIKIKYLGKIKSVLKMSTFFLKIILLGGRFLKAATVLLPTVGSRYLPMFVIIVPQYPKTN